LLEDKDSIEAAVVTRVNRSQTVAVALFALEDVDEAKPGFEH